MLMERPLTSMLTSTGADIADFTELSSESVGQLYACRYSNTSVVLGTRSASGLTEIRVGSAALQSTFKP